MEVRRRLGGAAYSVTREGLEMDNGQHVFLRGCLAYRSLLARLGSEHLVSVQPRLRIPVLKPGSEPFILRRSSLPGAAPSCRRPRPLPVPARSERLGAARAALALADRLRPRGARSGNARRLALGHGQGAAAVAALWDLIALPTLNLSAARGVAGAAAPSSSDAGCSTSPDDGDIGFHLGTLGEILGRPAERALARAGVEVRLGWRAERLERVGGGLEVHDSGEDGLSAEAVVVALPHARAAGLLEPLLGEQAARLRALGSSPIVNLHVVYDRVVSEHPFAAGVGTPVQYIFDRTAAAGAPAGSQYLAVSLSGAEREMAMSVDELRSEYLPALAELLPRRTQCEGRSFLVTREHAATFRASPGVGALRPGPRTAVPGLVLAGSWTATEWPATLESAVLSGHAAARIALEETGRPAAPGSAPSAAEVASRGAGRATGGGGGRRWRARVRRPRSARRGERPGDDLLLAAPMRIEAALISSARAGVGAQDRDGPAARRRRRACSRATPPDPAGRRLLRRARRGLGAGRSDHPRGGVRDRRGGARARSTSSCLLAGELISRLAGRGMKLRSGRIVCVSKIAVGERREQLHAGGAIGVDMESVWLAAGARERPFGVVRVVLDSPSHELFRLRAAVGALRAARALRRVAGALHEWTPAV